MFAPISSRVRQSAGIEVRLSIGLGSTRRGRLTRDLLIAPFFEHVAANEGGYQYDGKVGRARP